MKKLYLSFAFILAISASYAQMFATTADGRKIQIFSNGTWQYADAAPGSSNATSVSALYREAYDHAYDIIYGDEFFATERKQKAMEWATQYMRTGISIPIGYKSMEQWYDELFAFAFDHLYKNEFFSSERKNKANEWVLQVMKEKAYFEDMRTGSIARHKAAFHFAYNRLYRNEFFAKDRRSKSLAWANGFVKI